MVKKHALKKSTLLAICAVMLVGTLAGAALATDRILNGNQRKGVQTIEVFNDLSGIGIGPHNGAKELNSAFVFDIDGYLVSVDKMYLVVDGRVSSTWRGINALDLKIDDSFEAVNIDLGRHSDNRAAEFGSRGITSVDVTGAFDSEGVHTLNSFDDNPGYTSPYVDLYSLKFIVEYTYVPEQYLS